MTQDIYAELMADGLEPSDIKRLFNLTRGQSAGFYYRIRMKLGHQAQ